MTLSHAITMLEQLIAKHDANRHRYSIELLAHVAVQHGDPPILFTDETDARIYREAYGDALARKGEVL